MTPEQINAAIAELCGWCHVASPDYDAWYRPDGVYAGGATHDFKRSLENAGIPDYHSSLDAMSQAEAMLTDEECKTYARELYDKSKCNGLIDYEDRVACIQWASIASLTMTTASQRAIAFLRVKGWNKDDLTK